ncbi:hypothetical protein IQ260_13235 [Leptolyngbya cf. ectocarpi LEGE 11479]|uniref:Lipoprotein n=1 Tax=Leptolyngbya cf. ectocarpi LEGE 11479 TaxID=1828722 RepID=A0A928ZUD0_LEPEC|nr:hypothetical protein [Leptolyngbya ectocarpi]MBE9067621.1 hypothetical protein [Leptolyngbya cf. ectocarpi LEGE 11479]
MNKLLLGTCISLLCFSAYGCMSPSLSSLEQLSSEQQQKLLEKLHISDLCNYYLDPELQGETETVIAGFLRGRGVQNCSSDGVDKAVPAK